jgi:NAD(P)H-dependent FMN reductase
MRAGRTYSDGRVTAWSREVDACEAFVFLTPEYNHGVPGAFKNAVDHLGPEWQGKTVAFVSWGSEGGVRAVEQWRAIVSNFRMVDVRQQVALSTRQEVKDGRLHPSDQRSDRLAEMLDELVDLSLRLRR